MWQLSLRLSFLFVVTLVMVTQFTNCGTYSAANNDSSSSSAVSCTNATCITPTLDNLSVTAHLAGGAQFSVPSNLTDWNIGGDCNEGGYPYNSIIWELYLNGAKVRTSSMSGMVAGSSVNVNSMCVNGRFLVYVNLASITSDPVNRTGLMTGSGATRAQYDLYIEVYGLQTPTGTPDRNTTSGRTHISLLAI
jgi:hypothetical protein